MPVHTYNAAMTCGGCSGAITRILTKQLQEGEKFDVSKIAIRDFIEGGNAIYEFLNSGQP